MYRGLGACLLVNIPSSLLPLRPNTNSNLPFFSTFSLENFPRVPPARLSPSASSGKSFCLAACIVSGAGARGGGKSNTMSTGNERDGSKDVLLLGRRRHRCARVSSAHFPRPSAFLRSLFCNGYNFLLSHIAFHLPRSTSSFSSLVLERTRG